MDNGDTRKRVQGRHPVGQAWVTITNMKDTKKASWSRRRNLAWATKGILGLASTLGGLMHGLHDSLIMKHSDTWARPKDESYVRVITKWAGQGGHGPNPGERKARVTS